MYKPSDYQLKARNKSEKGGPARHNWPTNDDGILTCYRSLGYLRTLQISENPAYELSFVGNHFAAETGKKLPRSLNKQFENIFNTDFGDVRIHSDSAASNQAGIIKARAFTIGSDIYFGTGYYRPDSFSGQSIIAHELAHVIQQRRDRPIPQLPHTSSRVENDARSAAEKATAGKPVLISGRVAPGIACDSFYSPIIGAKPANNLSDDELRNEIGVLCAWLSKIQESNPEVMQVKKRIEELRLVAAKREYVAAQYAHTESSRKQFERDLALSQRSPGLLHMLLPAHTRYTYRDPSGLIANPLLRFSAGVNTEAIFKSARFTRDLAAAAIVITEAIAILTALNFAILGEGTTIAAVAGASRVAYIVGNELQIMAGALRAVGGATLTFYLQNAIAVNEIGIFVAGLLISIEGDVPGFLRAMAKDPIVAAQILMEVWILHINIQTANGSYQRVKIQARPLPINEQTDPRRLKLRIITQPEFSPISEETVTSRKPRGFEPTSIGIKQRVKAGTLEGLETTQQKPTPRPRGESVTREEQLEGIDFSRSAKTTAARVNPIQLPEWQNRMLQRANQFFIGHDAAVGAMIVEGESPMFIKSGQEGGPWGGTQRGGIPRGKGYGFTSGGCSQGNIATHVEGHAAAIMWQRRLRRAILIVDRGMCKICGKNLSATLPPGAELTVISSDEGTTIVRSSHGQ